MAEITELKKHIINYAKTKEIYTAYRESGFSGRFYEVNVEAIFDSSICETSIQFALSKAKNPDEIFFIIYQLTQCEKIAISRL